MMKELTLLILGAILLYVFLFFLYGGMGYGVAWILDKGLNVTVNYSVFVWTGIAILILRLIPAIIKSYLEGKIKDKKLQRKRF